MVKSATLRLAVVAAALACAVALAFASCGDHPTRSGGLQAADSTFTDSMGSLETAPPDALAELDELECPAGVDEGLWAELKGALEGALFQEKESRFSNRDSPSTESRLESRDSGGGKFASAPPTGEANRVNDLAIADNGDGSYTLSWHYRNLGDYGQNGTVGISDITPIAMHFGETYDPVADPNCIQAVIDGSGNGRIGIEDVTPIAQCFQVEVDHYVVEGIDDYEQPYLEVAQVALPEGTRTARLELAHGLGVPPYQYWRVVPVDADGARGQTSNVVSTVVGEPPQIISVSPTGGDSGTEATFSAEVTGGGPFEYYWNLGGGASPNQSSQPAPAATLSHGGTLPEPITTYPASLTVTNPFGMTTHDFALDVSAWWHVEEIPKVPGYEGITSASYVFGPDGSLWGKQSYSTPPGNFLVRIVDGAIVECEEVEGTLAVDSLNNPARMYRVETGFLTYDYYFSRRVEGQWSEGELLESGVTGYMPTQVFFDSANRAVIVYTLDSSEIWVARRLGPGEWERTHVWEEGSAVSWMCGINADDVLHILCNSVDEDGVVHLQVTGESAESAVILRNDPDHRHIVKDLQADAGRLLALFLTSHETTSDLSILGGSTNTEHWTFYEVTSRPPYSEVGSVGGYSIAPVGESMTAVFFYFYQSETAVIYTDAGGHWSKAQDFTLHVIGDIRLKASPGGNLVLLSKESLATYW